MTVAELADIMKRAVKEGYADHEVGGLIFNNFYDFRELFVTTAPDGTKLFVFELDIEADA
jgi:hypothetical protein